MSFKYLFGLIKNSFKIFSSNFIDWNKNSILAGIARGIAASFYEVYQAILAAETRTDPTAAEGTDLDTLGSIYGLSRLVGTRANGEVSIATSSVPASYIEIPVGTRVFSNDGLEYETTKTAIIPSSSTFYPSELVFPNSTRYYAVPLASEEYDYTELDSDGNVLPASTIAAQLDATSYLIPISAIGTRETYNIPENTLVSTDANVAGEIVVNPRPIVGGRGQETDDQYRNRLLSHIRGIGTQSNKSRIEAVALGEGVYYAKVLERDGCSNIPAPPFGAVYLIICSTTIPSSIDYEVMYTVVSPNNIYETIRNKVEDIRPLGVGIVVKEATVLNLNFSPPGIGITIDEGYDPTVVQAQVENNLYTYFLTNKGIGEGVYKAEIIECILGTEGVLDCDLDFTMTLESSVNISTVSDSYEAMGNEVILFKTASSPLIFVED